MTKEEIKGLMIPQEKVREIVTKEEDALIQIAIKHDDNGTTECISARGSVPAVILGIYKMLCSVSDEAGIPVSEIAETILHIAKMEEANEQKSEVK